MVLVLLCFAVIPKNQKEFEDSKTNIGLKNTYLLIDPGVLATCQFSAKCRAMGRNVFGIKEAFDALSFVYYKVIISTPSRKSIDVVVQPLLVRTFAVRIAKHEIIRKLQQPAVT